MNRVLCPVDFSAGSDRAMRVAIRIANERDAELILFHAWHAPATTGDYTFPNRSVMEIADVARAALEDELRRATELGARKVATKLTNGPAWSMIVEALQEPSFELAVMGTEGLTGSRNFLLGSVAERVVRHAPRPVLTIRPDGELAPFANALVPVDFSASSHDAMALAAEMITRDGLGITLLYVVEASPFERAELLVPGVGEVLDKRAAEMLDAWAAELRPKVAVPVNTRLAIGRPGPEVLAILDEDRSFDLVVTGSHGRTGIRRVLLGSVAEKIVRHAPCAVLVARRAEADIARSVTGAEPIL
jgi:nucleotide-binding universal stress UspA family protein